MSKGISVKELIEKLLAMPQEAIVVLDDERGSIPIRDIRLLEYQNHPSEVTIEGQYRLY